MRTTRFARTYSLADCIVVGVVCVLCSFMISAFNYNFVAYYLDWECAKNVVSLRGKSATEG
ncbi:hypothetical protein BDV06DRAFT_195512 [Aspergillus oleicola]